MRMRSVGSARCGEVNRPVRRPSARRADSIMAQTEPLPLVPATCTKRQPVLRPPERVQHRADALQAELGGLDFVAQRVEELDRIGVVHAARELQRAGDVRLHFQARHHVVQHAVLEQKFAALEALGQFLADGLLDDARAGEADQRARFGDVQIAQHGVAGGDAARGGVGEHADVRQRGPRPGASARRRFWPSASG